MSDTRLTLNELNQLNEIKFNELFGNVIECWPDAAKYIFTNYLPISNFNNFINVFDEYLKNLDDKSKEQILQLHPDLAGRLAAEGKLTIESTNEQQLAGLNNLTQQQSNELNQLNEIYKSQNGFPFVVCVRETNKLQAILKALNERLKNDKQTELNCGIDEVKKICKLRIKQIINMD